MAGEMLRAEGFTDVRYVQGDKSVDHSVWIASGEMDFSINYVPIHVASIDAGVPIKVLAGLHSGCLELIANDSVERITDLRGKRVGVFTLDSPQYVLVALMAAYVGLDPVNDIEWVIEEHNFAEGFVAGKFDAFLGQPTRVAGAARQENRPYDPQHDHRRAVVAAFLLHDFRHCGLCEQIPDSDETGSAGPSSRVPTSARPIRLG